MRNMPVPCTKDTVITVLEDMLHHLREDDSFEGSVEYLMPEPPEGHDLEIVDGHCRYCGMGVDLETAEREGWNAEEKLREFHAGDPRTTADGRPTQFMLRASYRIGNYGGSQGGLRMIGEMR